MQLRSIFITSFKVFYYGLNDSVFIGPNRGSRISSQIFWFWPSRSLLIPSKFSRLLQFPQFFSSSCGVAVRLASKTSSSTATTGKLSSLSSSTFGQSTGSGVSVDDVFPEGRILEVPNLRIFTFAELRSATRGFKPETVLGEGGFGRVYKGWVEEKTLNPAKSGLGMMVAVKKLNPESMQGLEEWQVISLCSTLLCLSLLLLALFSFSFSFV